MEINAAISNPLCNGLSTGQISVLSVTLTTSEQSLYGSSYVFDWTSNVSADNLDTTGRVASSLPADTYGVRIIGNSNISDYEYFTLTEPEALEITGITNLNNPCETVSSINVNVTGGTAPYSATYGSYRGTSDTGEISITGIAIAQDSSIIVSDTNNCEVSTDTTISTIFTNITHSISDVSAPLVYDDHLSGFNIAVDNGTAPYKFIVYESEDGVKTDFVTQTDVLDTSKIISNSGNAYTYDLSEILYPGSYIIQIVDSNGCETETSEQILANSTPMNIVQTVSANTAPDVVTGVEISNFYDTILIPYKMIQTNSDVSDFVKNLRYKSKLSIKVGDSKYSQSVIKFGKDTSQYNNNTFSILHLGADPTEWFFEINITRGFTVDDNILSQDIVLEINGQEYTVEPLLNNSSSTCKLIKGNFTTSSSVAPSLGFNAGQLLGFYVEQNNERELFQTIECADVYNLVDIHSPGLLLCVNLLHSENLSTMINISSNSVDFTLEQLEYISDTRKILDRFNMNQDPFYVAIQDKKQYEGVVSFTIAGGSPEDNTYQVEHLSVDENNNLKNIYFNNEIYTGNNLNGLLPGTYITKIRDQYNNIPNTVNSSTYSDLYTEYVNYIVNTLNTDTTTLNFEYGDILSILEDASDTGTDETTTVSTDNEEDFIDFLIDPPEVEIVEAPDTVLPSDSTETTPTIAVTQNETYNNTMTITSPSAVNSIISGPNGFSHAFNGSIIFVNMPSGVYTIVGNADDLYSSKFHNRTVKVYISNNFDENIDISYVSYLNTFTIG